MSIDLFRPAGVERASAAATPAAAETSNPDRERLKRIAAEFESMLLVQVLRDMRKAGSWDDGESGGLGFESLFETVDVELASHLSRMKGLGLSPQLLEAFDRASGASGVNTNLALPPRAVSVPPAPPASSNSLVSAVRAAADVTAAAPRAVAHWVRPVAGAVTSAFGWRQDPFTKEATFHKGVDLRAAYGQEVHAAGAGRVVFSGEQGGYGTTVVVEHGDGSQTRYAHLSARTVEKGDRIEAGAVLGRAGRSGRATGTHLHFEVIAPDGRRMQPDQVAALQGGWAAE